MIPLSDHVRARIALLFSTDEQPVVEQLIAEECADNLPLISQATADFWDRIRFAALKLSGGDVGKLRSAIEVAKQDWRDTLVAAGFAEHLDAHRNWNPERSPRARRASQDGGAND